MNDWYAYLQRSWLAQNPLARIALFVVGLLLVIVGGLLGLVPLLPGWPLGIVGAVMMSISSNRVRCWMWMLAARLPERVRKHLHFLDPANQQDPPTPPQGT